MRIKRVKDLAKGDTFIWADGSTRSNMVHHIYEERLQPLVCIKVDKGVGDDVIEVRVLGKTVSERLYFMNTDLALIIDPSKMDELCDYGVLCCNCNERYGRHRGVQCHPKAECRWAVRVFVPNGDELRRLHPEQFKSLDDVDFFDSIGL
jgi:hypothetical protein